MTLNSHAAPVAVAAIRTKFIDTAQNVLVVWLSFVCSSIRAFCYSVIFFLLCLSDCQLHIHTAKCVPRSLSYLFVSLWMPYIHSHTLFSIFKLKSVQATNLRRKTWNKKKSIGSSHIHVSCGCENGEEVIQHFLCSVALPITFILALRMFRN